MLRTILEQLEGSENVDDRTSITEHRDSVNDSGKNELDSDMSNESSNLHSFDCILVGRGKA